MGNFCPYCGTPFTDGKCTCELFKQNNPGLFTEPAAPVAPVAEPAPQAQPVAAAPQAAPQPAAQPVAAAPQPVAQPAPQAPAGENPFGLMFKLIGKSFAKPVSTPMGVEGMARFSGIILLGCLAVIAFTLKFLPYRDFEYYSLSGHFKSATFYFLVIAGGVAAKAGIAKIFIKNGSYLDIFGKFGMSLVYPACAFVAGTFFGIFSYNLSHLILAFGVVAWMVITSLIILDYLKDEKPDKKGIVLAACSAACVLVYNVLSWIF